MMKNRMFGRLTVGSAAARVAVSSDRQESNAWRIIGVGHF